LKFARDQIAKLTIRHVGPGSIRVGDELLNRSFAIIGEEIIRDWQPCGVEDIAEDDLHALIAATPELILIGTGAKAVFPPRDLVFSLARRNIGLETMDTAAACRTFNILIGDGRRVAAVMIVDG
jgi:uncharacterized protein